MSWLDQRPDDAMSGAFEAIGPDPVQTVDPTSFREAMARLGAAVHVVTTQGESGRTGFTATAVCSVSDQPPTVLICINRRSQIAPILRNNGAFCINTLAAGQESIADIFAGRTGAFMEDRFVQGEWLTLTTGCPVLEDAVIALDCRVIDVKAVASHDVYFGAVSAVRFGAPRPVLVYHDRVYKAV